MELDARLTFFFVIFSSLGPNRIYQLMKTCSSSGSINRPIRQRQDLATTSESERWINDLSAKETYEQELLTAIRVGENPNDRQKIDTDDKYEAPVYDEALGRRRESEYAEKLTQIVTQRANIIRALRSSPKHQQLSPFDRLLIETEYYTGVREWYGGAESSPRDQMHSHASQEQAGESSSQTLDMMHLTDTPSYIRGSLRPYQIEGVNWLLGLFSRCVSGILADEMGLGKTFQTIAMLAYLKFTVGMPGPHLVVCPKSVLGNWFREFKRWCPALKVYKFHCSSSIRADIVRSHLQPSHQLRYDVIVTTYEMVLEELPTFKKIRWKYLVIDEAHKLKNDESRAHTSLTSLSTAQRLIITGTPLQNNLKELWALLHFLAPRLFDDAASFDTWFDTASGQQDAEVMSNIHKMLSPLMIRRLKVDVNTGIPPKKEIYVSCRLTKKQREWYLHVLSKDSEILNKAKGGTSALNNMLMQLRKVINHPYLLDGVEEGPPFIVNESIVKVSGKMLILDKLLHRLKGDVEGEHKVLIFSQFTSMIDILEDYCRMRHFKTHRIDGNTSGYDRDTQMAAFNAPKSDSFIFLLSTRAGGLGINLQAANHVIIYDSDWNPQMDLQAQDRAHRIGQKRSVRVYRFVTDGTVEEKIYRRALKKLYLDAVVVQQGRMQSKVQQNVSKAELLSMIKFGAEEIFKARHDDITEADIDHLLDEGESKTEELNNEAKQQVSMSLASFELGAEEANIYEFEGVSFKAGVESRILHLTLSKPISQSALEAECNQFGEVLKVILHPNLSEALISFRSVTDALEAKSHLPYECSFASRENQSIVSNEMISECLGGGEKLGRGHRIRDTVKFYGEEEETQHRSRPSSPRGMSFKPLPNYPPHQLYNKKRLSDLHQKEAALRYEMAQQPAELKTGEANPAPDAEKVVLSAFELEEREKLLSEGFASWTKWEYRTLINSLTSGRISLSNYSALAHAIGSKDEKEVREYLSALMERGEQCIPHFESIESRINKGQAKLQEREGLLRAAKWKIESCATPESQLTFKCSKNKALSEALDRQLFLAGYQADFDDKLPNNVIRQSPEFRFNVWCQSRSEEFMHRRLRIILQSVKREWEKSAEDDAFQPLRSKRRFDESADIQGT